MRSRIFIAIAAAATAVDCGGSVAQTAPAQGEDAGVSELTVIDESKLGKTCTATSQCRGKNDYGCVGFGPGYGFRCTTDPCGAIACPPKLTCTILLSEPGSVACQEP